MDKEFSSTTDREVYVETKAVEDSGTGWAVALIVLILAIGFGFVAFSNNQAASELRTTQAIEEVKRDNSLSSTIPTIVPPVVTPAPSTTNNVEVKEVPNPAAVPQAPAAAPAPAAPVETTPAVPAEPATSDDTE